VKIVLRAVVEVDAASAEAGVRAVVDWVGERRALLLAAVVLVVSQLHTYDIIAFMRTYLNDPTGVRGASVSEPALREVEGAKRYTVCLRYTAHKSNGQYAAPKESIVLFRDGRLDRIVDNARDQCKDAAYQPFPELERLSR